MVEHAGRGRRSASRYYGSDHNEYIFQLTGRHARRSLGCGWAFESAQPRSVRGGGVTEGLADSSLIDAQHAAVHTAMRRGRALQFATIGWNLMEVVVTIWLGLAAGSLALIAFGLDSIVEVFASLVVIWYISDHDARGRVQSSMRLVATSFALLAVYLLVASAWSIAEGRAADSSPLGIAYLTCTAIVMFTLAGLKRSIGRVTAPSPLSAEAAMTFLDGCLASLVLVALALNSFLGGGGLIHAPQVSSR